MKALQVTDLHKQYPGREREAVAGLSFALAQGEILALLGPNGAGKTSTVKMIAGLVLPSAGTVQVLGHDVVRQRQQAVRNLGAVLEGARNLYWRLSAWENLLYFGALRLVPRRQLRLRAEHLLQMMDLYDVREREVRHFSRGMQQKLAIAAALLAEPAVLLLDEPTLGLDVQSARRLEETIQRLAAEEGKAILLTTHTMPLAEKLAQRILVMHEGHAVASGETQALLARFNGHGDVVDIHLEDMLDPALQAALQARYPQLSLASGNGAPRLTWPHATTSQVLELLHFLVDNGVAVRGYGHRQPTLEEVFLKLTGAKQA